MFGFFRRSKSKGSTKVAPQGGITGEPKHPPAIMVDCRGFYDTAPLVLEKNPDLLWLFENPPVIQQLTKKNKEFWASASQRESRISLVTGYLQHPNPAVRQKTLGLMNHRDYTVGVEQLLVEILAADPVKKVRQAAAKLIWDNECKNHCQFAIESLRDEIDFGSENDLIGPSRARKALLLLSKNAPGEEERKMFDQMKHLFPGRHMWYKP